MIEYLKRLQDQFRQADINLVASALAFSTVLSLIPFFAVTLAILQRIGGVDSLNLQVEKWILSNFTEAAGLEGIRLIKAAMGRMMSGRLGLFGALFLVITTTRLVQDMEMGIHKVWNLKNPRPLFQRVFFYWAVILSFPFGLAWFVSSNATLGFSSSVHVGLLAAVLFFVYKIVPATRVSVSAAAIGSLAGSLSTFAIHRSFAWATKSLFNYGKLYGSIAAVPLILLWLLLIWYGVLLGAVVSASFQIPRPRYQSGEFE